jgi:hypothetical protein
MYEKCGELSVTPLLDVSYRLIARPFHSKIYTESATGFSLTPCKEMDVSKECLPAARATSLKSHTLFYGTSISGSTSN